MPTFQHFLLLALVGYLALFTVLLVRTFLFRSKRNTVPPTMGLVIDKDVIANNLSACIKIETISHSDRERINPKVFKELRAFLKSTYPRVHDELPCETINEHTLMYFWEGRNRELPPIVFLAHQDVVPADDTYAWKHPPFSGAIIDGEVWGRGAMDNKVNLIGIMEAIEYLLPTGFRPKRSIYVVLQHDEEIGGHEGAVAVAAHFEQHGINPEFIFDEGGMITSRLIKNVPLPVALIGVAEKGNLSIELKVECEGGHSSMPAKQTAVGILGRAISQLERHPFPIRPTPIIYEMFSAIGAELPFKFRFPLANLWLFSKLLFQLLLRSPQMAALLRTTTAVTLIEGGNKSNVLPKSARAVVNFRIIPGESIVSVIEQTRKIINDPRVQIRSIPQEASDPAPLSKMDSLGYTIIKKAVHQVVPEAIVAPFLVPALTDSRHFTGLSNNVFHFSPFTLTPDNVNSLHGNNERISLEDCGRVVRFYIQLLQNVND